MSEPAPANATADTFAAKAQEAQADLLHSIDRAGLRSDPFRHALQGLSDVVGLLPNFVAEIGAAIDRARQPVDSDAFEQAVKRLEKAAARGADLRSAALVRAHGRRTMLTYSLTFLIGVAAAAGGGYLWGQRTANAAIQQTEQHLALAFQNGPPAAATWANLMRSNDADLALAGCTGSALKVMDGRRACNVPLWLDPPSLAAPRGK
jgi:hypothetical protein